MFIWLVQEWAATFHSSESINMSSEIALDQHIADVLAV